MEPPASNVWWHRLATLTAAATLGLIGIGGLVTSHGVGMAVPDWPNTYGYNMFFFPFSQWVGGVFYEHSHRLAGSLVGLLTLLLALSLHGRSALPVLRTGSVVLLVGAGLAFAAHLRQARWAEVTAAAGAAGLLLSLFWPRGPAAPLWLRRMGNLALVLVLVQGVLGGLRVVLIKDQIGILHAALAQLFFLLLCLLAWCTSPSWRRWQDDGSATLRWWTLATTLAILLQLLLGAGMRHRHAGLAIPDFPLAYGQLWPATDAPALAAYNRGRDETAAINPLTAYDVHLHLAHRANGMLVAGLLLATTLRARRLLGGHRVVTRLAALWLLLGTIQIVLGAATVWTNKSADVATAHVVTGAGLLAVGGLLTVLTWRSAVARNRRAPARNPQDPPGLPTEVAL